MNSILSLIIYLCVGALGGYVGHRLRLPSGGVLGSMLSVVLFKLITQKNLEIPGCYDFGVQVMLGVMVGASFRPEMLNTIVKVAPTVIGSTAALIVTGVILSILFVRIGWMDMSTAFLSTSPGAMNIMISLAIEKQSNASLVMVFHFFRLVLVILTAPIILKYLSR